MPAFSAEELERCLLSLSTYSEAAVRGAIEAARDPDKAAQLLDALRVQIDENVLDDFTAIGLIVAMGEARVLDAIDLLLHTATRQDVDMGIFGEAAGYALQRMGAPAFDVVMRFLERPAAPWAHVHAYQLLFAAAGADPPTRQRVADFCAARAPREIKVAYEEEWHPGLAVCQALVALGDERARPLLETAIRESPHAGDKENYRGVLEELDGGEPPVLEWDWRLDWPDACRAWADILEDDDEAYGDEEDAPRRRENLEVADEFATSEFARTLEGHGWSAEGAADEIAHWLDFGGQYTALNAARLEPADVREVLYEWMPRKMSAEAEYFKSFPPLLEAFVRFLHATGRLADPEPLLSLAREARARLPALAADPGNWGMAKSFFMGGRAAGFDMTTQEGTTQWMAAYNASLAANRPAGPDPEPADPTYSVSAPFRRESPKVGRNDPCPCGSGKKYKKCCGR
jgi:hypothetical protein